MTIFSKFLRLLARLGDNRPEVAAERARCQRTEQAIERYDQMLNASTARRPGRVHSTGSSDIGDFPSARH